MRTLEAQNAEYEQVRRVLKKGGLEKEKVVRSRLQYIKPGEQVVHIEDQSDGTTTSTTRP